MCLILAYCSQYFVHNFLLSGHLFKKLEGCERVAFSPTTPRILKGVFEKIHISEQVSLGDTELNQVKHASLHRISQIISKSC